jgi:CHAT domain-containing protein
MAHQMPHLYAMPPYEMMPPLNGTMTRPSFKSLSLAVRGGLGLLFGGLLLVTPLHGESYSASYSAFEAGTVVTQNQGRRTEQLEPGKPLERKLAGGQSHQYEIRMNSEEFLRLVVDQRGIDLALVLFGPTGARITEVDNRQRERGLEIVSLIAKEPGVYRIEVRSLRQTDPLGSYQIKLEGLHPASEQDRATNKAGHLVADANTLQGRETKESTLQAIPKYQEALAAYDVAGDLQMKAVVLNKIGRSHQFLGEHQKALDYHNQALPLTRAAADPQEEASTLTDLGHAYRLEFENEKALDYLNQALQMWQLIKDRRGEWETLVTVGRLYVLIGEGHKSLSCFDQALPLSRVLSDQTLELNTLSSMGGSYYLLGENEKAAETWKQALVLARLVGSKRMETNMLSHLGSAYNALGDSEQSLTYLKQTIQMARDRGDRLDEAGALQTMGRVYRATGEPRKSIEYLDQSLILLKGTNYLATVARAHYNLGKAYTDLGEYQKALDYLNQALPVWKSKGDTINIAATIRELARAELGRGNLEAALAQSEAALNLMEWIRTRAGGSELRASYLAIIRNCFELRVEVLTRLHKLNPSRNYAAAALQTSERARARSLLETLAEAGVDLRRGVNPDLLKREQTITDELSAKASEQARLASMKSVEGQKDKIKQEVQELSAQLERVGAQIRAASPRYAELAQPQPLSLAEIREHVIDGQTLLLEYYLGEERSYLWAVTSTSIESYDLPRREVIEAAARQVYELLTARNRRVKFETVEERRARIAKAESDYPAAARALSQIVLGPVAGQLGSKRLLIVSDGALQYIPFAALPIPLRNGSSTSQPLTMTNEVVSLPSASTLAVLRREVAKHQPAPKTIAVIADPVFTGDDQRVKDSLARNKVSPAETTVAARRATTSKSELQRSASESGWDGEALNMTRLPFTRREADAIAALVPATYRKQELDFAASLSNATSADLAQYRIVHFATHGFLNSRHPELSGIVLSLVDEKGQDQEGFLRAHDIYDLKIPAELVVLSGCRTGLGKDIRGEGLVGLTRAFMHAGAARVLVSLWDVQDEATAELMTRFYGYLLGREKLSPAAALRAAQGSMARDRRWSSPYYWAGFTLQGEPR